MDLIGDCGFTPSRRRAGKNLRQIPAAVLLHLIDRVAAGVVPGIDVDAVLDEQLDAVKIVRATAQRNCHATRSAGLRVIGAYGQSCQNR